MASPCAFPRYKPIERSPRLLPVVLADQVQSGRLEFALDHFLGNAMAGALATRLFGAEERRAARLRRTRRQTRMFEPQASLRVCLAA